MKPQNTWKLQDSGHTSLWVIAFPSGHCKPAHSRAESQEGKVITMRSWSSPLGWDLFFLPDSFEIMQVSFSFLKTESSFGVLFKTSGGNLNCAGGCCLIRTCFKSEFPVNSKKSWSLCSHLSYVKHHA